MGPNPHWSSKSHYVNTETLPVVGPWFQRVGQVVDIMAVPCSPTPMMWVKGFFTQIPWLVWSLFKPDPIDATWERFGFPGATHRHGRMKVGGKIQGIPITVPRNAATTVLFKLGSLAQKVGWWFCIVDAGTKFAVNWASAVYQYAGCLPGTNQPASGETDFDWPLVGPVREYVPWSIITNPGNRLTAYEMLFRFGDTKQYAVNPTFSHWLPEFYDPPEVGFDIVNVTSGRPVHQYTGSSWPWEPRKDSFTLNGASSKTLPYFNSNTDVVTHPYQLRLRATVYKGAANLKGTTVTLGGGGLGNILNDPL